MFVAAIRKDNRVFFVLMIAVLALLMSLFIQLRQIIKYEDTSDFSAYYGAYILKQGANRPLFVADERINNPQQYELAQGLKGELRNYLYPPLFAQSLSIFMPADYQKARVIWCLLSHLALALTFIVTVKLIMTRDQVSVLPVVSLCVLLFVVFSPIERELNYGQFSIIMTMLVWSGYYFLVSGKRLLSSALMALATVVKLYPAFFFIVLALRKEKLAFAAMLLFTLLFVTTSVYFWGGSDWFMFKDLMARNFIVTMAYDSAQSVSAIYQVPNYSPTHLTYLLSDQFGWDFDALTIWKYVKYLVVALGGLVLAVFHKVILKKSRDIRIFGFGLMAVCLVSPLLWNHIFILLLPLLAYLLAERIGRSKFTLRDWLLVFSVFLIAFPDYMSNLALTDSGVLVIFKFTKLYGLLALLALSAVDLLSDSRTK